MSIDQLSIGTDVEDSNTDTLGGGVFTQDTGLYPMIVDMAYLGKSAGGAMSLNLHMKMADDIKKVVRQTLWVTSGDAKGNKNYYVKDGKKYLLPGMIQADQISLITTGKHIGALTTEEKTIKLWDFASRSEKPTKVNALTDMIGKPILVGLHKCRENKRTDDGSGNYVDTNAERVFNEIHRIFFPDGFSVAEKQAEAEEAVFAKKWKEKFDAEYVNDTYKPVADSGGDSLPNSTPSTGPLFGNS